MTSLSVIRKIRIALAVTSTGMLLIAPLNVVGSEHPVRPASPTSQQIADIALGQGNTLTGVVYDHQSTGSAGISITARHLSDGKMTSGSTNAEGVFNFAGLRPGNYSINANGQHRIVCLWSPGTAPPNAQPALSFVTDGEIVRGQYGHGKVGHGDLNHGKVGHGNYGHEHPIYRHPKLIGAAMAGLIGGAIVLNAVDDNDAS